MESVGWELLNRARLVLWLELFVYFPQILLNKAGLEREFPLNSYRLLVICKDKTSSVDYTL